MNKSDPKLSADQQDKRSVIQIEMQDVDQWLAGTVKDATELLRLAPVEMLEICPIWYYSFALEGGHLS